MKCTIAFAVALIGIVNCGYIGDEHGGLRNIAQGSANQAHSAVAGQHAAAQKASYLAKNALAQQASQAAATAQAALAGKHVLLQTLEQQRDEAQKLFEGELNQLKGAEQSAKAASNTAEQARKQAHIIQSALAQSQELAGQAENSAATANQELLSQGKMVAQAKAALGEVEHRLEATRADFVATKEATQKAIEFAQKAQHNANSAAVHSESHHDSGAANAGAVTGQNQGGAHSFH